MLLEIRNIRVLSGDGQTADLHRVHCPAHDRTVALEQCLSCAESGGVTNDPVTRIEYTSCRHTGAGADRRRDAEARVIAPVLALARREEARTTAADR